MIVTFAFTSSNVGGAEKSLAKLIQTVSKEGIKIRVFLWSAGGPAENLFPPDLLLKRRRNLNASRSIFIRLLQRFVPSKSDIDLIFAEHSDCIYVIGWRLSIVVRARQFLRRKRAKVIVGMRWVPASNSRLDRAFRAIEPKLSKYCDGYICNSNAAVQELKKIGIKEGKLHLCYNGVEHIEGEAVTTGLELRTGMCDFSRVVLTVANHSPRKGLLEYIDFVIYPLIQIRRNIEFVILGRDDMHGAVSSRIKHLGIEHAVKVIGFSATVNEFYRKATCFVLPSLHSEGCPTSIIEASSFGVPSVCFDIPGLNECVVDKKTGYICKIGDYIEMRKAIIDICFDVDLRLTLGRNALYFATEKFDIKKNSSDHLDLIRSITRAK